MRPIFLFFMLPLLVGCGQFRPFVDAKHEAGQVGTVGQSSEEFPAVCFNPLWSDMTQVALLAETECQKQKKHAVLIEKEYFSCCLFLPSTAFYECQK